ncbi:MAG: anti-sigma factor [SAR202 cluster bacterium]|nr:anti-sigma factor [SAR202 cluster bacterium]
MEELAALFSLESLPKEEHDAYAAHLPHCRVCRDLADQYVAASAALPHSLDEAPASPGFKNRVLSQARQDLEHLPASSPASPRPHGLLPKWLGGLFGPTLRPALGALALLLIAALIGWNVVLQIQSNNDSDQLADQQAFLAAIASGAAVTPLNGTDAAPNATATLVTTPGGDEAFLLVKNLPALSSDQRYQVWRITGDTPQGIGLFALSKSDTQLVALRTSFTGAKAIGVSIEPKRGSLAPTGPIVLLGSF